MKSRSLPGRGLGTRLRHLIELLDRAVAKAYDEHDLSFYRPRFTPVMRALQEMGPSTISAIAAHAGVTHSAASQTTSEMRRAGLLTSAVGRDARERLVSMTPALVAILPRLEERWEATARAERMLDKSLPVSLRAAVDHAIAALEAESFTERIRRAHPTVAARAAHPLKARKTGARESK